MTNEKLTSREHDEEAWAIIENVLPHIQMGINQRRPRFTTISPNMLMFGTNMNDACDIDGIRRELKEQRLKVTKEKDKIQFEAVIKYLEKIKAINKVFKEDWQKYTKLSKKTYEERHLITQDRINNTNKVFKQGSKVLYFIGDKEVLMRKWKQRWTGPWRIKKVLNDTTVIIYDKQTLNQIRVNKDRIKAYKAMDYVKYSEICDGKKEYSEQNDKLIKRMSKHNVEVRGPTAELDFNKRRK